MVMLPLLNGVRPTDLINWSNELTKHLVQIFTGTSLLIVNSCAWLFDLFIQFKTSVLFTQ